MAQAAAAAFQKTNPLFPSDRSLFFRVTSALVRLPSASPPALSVRMLPPPPGSQSIFPDPSSSFIPPRHPGTPLKGFQCTIQHLHPRSPCSSSWRPPPRQPVHHHPFASSIPHRQKRPLPQPLAPPPSPLSPSSTLPSSPQRGRGAQCPPMRVPPPTSPQPRKNP